jgi:hypothetical protein
MMGRFSKALAAMSFCAMSVVTLASPAAAQTDDGREPASQRVAEKTMADFARCVVSNKKRQAQAMAYLQIPDGDPAQGAAGSALASKDCAPRGSQMRFQPDLFARSIYTALYRKYYFKTVPGELPTSQASDYQSEYKVTSTPVGNMQMALRVFGDCTVLQDPKAAHEFAISEMRGQSERAAVPAVVAAMQGCVNTGSTLKFSRTMLKGIIAESLYKMRSRQTSVASAGAAQ